MFQQLDVAVRVPRWIAVVGAVLGAFGLGIWVGKLLTGGRPFDWVLDISDAAFTLGLTIWFAFKAIKR